MLTLVRNIEIVDSAVSIVRANLQAIADEAKKIGDDVLLQEVYAKWWRVVDNLADLALETDDRFRAQFRPRVG